MTTNETPDTGTLEQRLEPDLAKLRPADEVSEEVDRLWPDNSPKWAALIYRIERHRNEPPRPPGSVTRAESLLDELLSTLRTVSAENERLTARIAKLEGQLATAMGVIAESMRSSQGDLKNAQRGERTAIAAYLVALAKQLEYSECRQETKEFYETANASTILRHLSQEVCDGDSLPLAPVDVQQQIEQARTNERAKCVAELEAEAERLDNLTGRDREQAHEVAHYSGTAAVYRQAARDLAADHLEANGRAQG